MRRAVLFAIALLAALAALALIQQGAGWPRRIAGGLLVAAGLPLVLLARRQLGEAFAVSPRAKGLVKTGLYARIPHPMYLFLDTVLLGAILLLGRAWPLLLWGGLVGVQAWQARREAQVLEGAFGDAYREYRSRTWW